MTSDRRSFPHPSPWSRRKAAPAGAFLAAALLLGGTHAWGQAVTGQSAEQANALPQHPPARMAYQKARTTCMKLAGNQRDVCQAAARLELTQAEALAHAEKKNDAEAAAKGRLAVAQAEYDLALEMCQDQREPEQRNCVANATRALAQAKEREGGLEAPEARPQR